MRPSWDEYWSEIARVSSKRSTCLKNKVGCVIVKDNRLLSLGYNGNIRGYKHCEELGGCIRLDKPHGVGYEECRGIHAEMNAIIWSARNGIQIQGSKIYITTSPCNICKKMLIQVGIEEIIYPEGDELKIERISMS